MPGSLRKVALPALLDQRVSFANLQHSASGSDALPVSVEQVAIQGIENHSYAATASSCQNILQEAAVVRVEDVGVNTALHTRRQSGDGASSTSPSRAQVAEVRFVPSCEVPANSLTLFYLDHTCTRRHILTQTSSCNSLACLLSSIMDAYIEHGTYSVVVHAALGLLY